MMRLRRASVIVTVYPLASAATASAEWRVGVLVSDSRTPDN
jgi:hypothetical protein